MRQRSLLDTDGKPMFTQNMRDTLTRIQRMFDDQKQQATYKPLQHGDRLDGYTIKHDPNGSLYAKWLAVLPESDEIKFQAADSDTLRRLIRQFG